MGGDCIASSLDGFAQRKVMRTAERCKDDRQNGVTGPALDVGY